MHTFPELLKKIRDEAGITQKELADRLKVSTVLIAMVETGQKDPSKKLITKLAKEMDVHPSSITPFIFSDKALSAKQSGIEKHLIFWGEKLQRYLIKTKAKNLKR